MPLKRGHVYGIRTSLPEFVNACLGLAGSHHGQLVSSAIRPCVLVSCSPESGTCQVALLATFNNTAQEDITDPVLRHFAIPTSELQPRLGLSLVDPNRPSTSLSSSNANSERRNGGIRHQYILALFGSILPSHLVEWTDNETQSSIHFSESAMRRLEALATQRMQLWMQMQSGQMLVPAPAPAPTYYHSASSHTSKAAGHSSTFRAPWP